jgi:mRNA interferase MazF
MPGQVVRGDVVKVNFDPAVGSEPNKARPWVVIQNDTGNKYSSVFIVAAITDIEHVPKRYPVDVPVKRGEGGLEKDSVVQCNLIRCVSEKRLISTYGHFSPAIMQRVDQALKISLALA